MMNERVNMKVVYDGGCVRVGSKEDGCFVFIAKIGT